MMRQGMAGDAQRLLMEACLDAGVSFLWNGPGLMLIEPSGVGAIVKAVTAAGATVLGFDGFERASAYMHPRLDLIFDAEARPDIQDPLLAISEWPTDVWIDVALKV